MSDATSGQLEVAILGGGCFWCLEAVYQNVSGVRQVVSGYMGGHVARPGYEEVCGKKTGHAEVVRIAFDPSLLGYEKLLEIFFSIHDCTTPDRQGNDVGPQYRSVIFATSASQLRIAQQMIAALRAQGIEPVTELIDVCDTQGIGTEPVEKVFWRAEDEHQNYFAAHPNQGYCMFVVAPKVKKAQEEFKALIAR